MLLGRPAPIASGIILRSIGAFENKKNLRITGKLLTPSFAPSMDEVFSKLKVPDSVRSLSQSFSVAENCKGTS